jgi:hypothetical protein
MAEKELLLSQNWNEENETIQMSWPRLTLSVSGSQLNTKLRQTLLFWFAQIVFQKLPVGKFNGMLVDVNF